MLKTANNEDENDEEDENDGDEDEYDDDEEARVKIKGYCHLPWDQATCLSLSFQPLSLIHI